MRVFDRSIRRPSYPGLRQVGLLTLVMSVFASCGGESGDGDGAASSANSSTRADVTHTSPTRRSATPRPQRVRQAPILRVGETHRLVSPPGIGEGPIDVAVTRVIAPLPLSSAEQRFFGTSRFVAIELSFANRGMKTFEAALSFSRLFTSDDSVVDAEIFTFAHCRSLSSASPIIAARRGGRGCVAFRVSQGAKLRTFQYRPLLFLPSSVKWDLRGR